MLLAQLWATVASALGSKQHSPFEIAPWLEDPTVRKERLQKQEHERRIGKAAMIRAAYEVSSNG